jgi:hypothetical protein
MLSGNLEFIGNDWAIKRPDGRYELLEDRSFGSEAEALAYMQERHSRYEAKSEERQLDDAKH